MNVGWITPRANAAYRRAILGPAAPMGMSELTFPEMNSLFSEVNEFTAPSDRGLLRLSYHGRAALVLAPLVFGGLAIVLLAGERRRARSAPVILIGLTLYAAYGLAPDWSRIVATGSAPPILVAWAPNGFAALLALALIMIRPRDPLQSIH